MGQAETKDWEVLAATMRQTLSANLGAALSVAGNIQEENGNLNHKMTLTDLNRQTGISRSTLSKLANGKTLNETQANPDLETICRLASALNLSPAFLLMTPKDWQRLLGALNGLQSAMGSTHLEKLTSATTDIDMASVGLHLAEELGLYPDKACVNFDDDEENSWKMNDEMNSIIAHGNKMKRLAILTTTALTQRPARNRDDIALLTAIGAIFGANFDANFKPT